MEPIPGCLSKKDLREAGGGGSVVQGSLGTVAAVDRGREIAHAHRHGM